MQQADFQKFKSMIIGVADCYGQTLTAEGIAMRFKLLERFSFAEVERAALAIMSTRKYTTMPTPGDFMEYLTGGNVEDLAEVEAGKVVTAIGQWGGYRSVVFDDPVTQAVIMNAYGGWIKLCEECGVEDSEKWFRKEFAKTYAAYRRQGVEHYGVLAGLTEVENTARGFSQFIEPPAYIGNPDKAQAVALGSSPGHRPALSESDGPVHIGEVIRSVPVLDVSEAEQ